ncbi:ABC transporter substrate-binding protein [Fusibacter sp. 3D3]|uniref:ABC transporter substrate-binding protein n=1 Tax=Fusibacter sp. 3D3 TaxID=1048380 RepID=UPI000853593E|nr:ABC transporter substrate-binding protein [Fusibacter sp. 3D3]GAU76443.1 lysine-arginine-ornithine-binding periplasmic protein precursor [Fusibacter sp. 3D3]
MRKKKIALKRKTILKRMTLGLLVSMMLLTLFGCQSKTETTYDKVASSKEMTFAMTGAYPPFNFIDSDGNLTGFDIDIANALAEQLGVKAVPITTAWDGILGGLTSKRFDTIIGSMAITEARLEKVNFTSPYYYDGAQFFVPTDSNIENLDALQEGIVGVVTGTTFHDMLKEKENIADIMQFESDVDNFMALGQGRMDGLVTGKFVGLQAPEKYDVDIKPAGTMLYAEEIGIAVRKDDTVLLEKLNAALATIIENGTYQEISEKWFGVNILEQ